MKACAFPLIIFTLFALASGAARAGTTNALVEACKSPPGSMGEQICNAYINGLGEGILADQITREDGTSICLPEGITTPQIRDRIISFVNRTDIKVLQLPTGGVVAAALQSAFPCRK